MSPPCSSPADSTSYTAATTRAISRLLRRRLSNAREEHLANLLQETLPHLHHLILLRQFDTGNLVARIDDLVARIEEATNPQVPRI